MKTLPKYFFYLLWFEAILLYKKWKEISGSLFIANGKSASYRESKIFAFFYLALLSHAKMENRDSSSSLSQWWYVCSYHVEKTPNVNLLKLQSWAYDFQKESKAYLEFWTSDTRIWYNFVLLYLTFQTPSGLALEKKPP